MTNEEAEEIIIEERDNQALWGSSPVLVALDNFTPTNIERTISKEEEVYLIKLLN